MPYRPDEWQAVQATLADLRARFDLEAARAIQQTTKSEADQRLIELAKNRVLWLRSAILGVQETLRGHRGANVAAAGSSSPTPLGDETALRLSGDFKSLCVAHTLAKDIPERAFDLLAVHDEPIRFGLLNPMRCYALVFQALGSQHFLTLMAHSRQPNVSPLCGTHSQPHRDRDTFYLGTNDQKEQLFDASKLPAIAVAIRGLIPLPEEPPILNEHSPDCDPNSSYTIGRLIGELTAVSALKIRAEKQSEQAGAGPPRKGTLQAHYRIAASKAHHEMGRLAKALRARPGVDSVQAICESKNGKFDAVTLRWVRGELSINSGIPLAELNAMTPGQFADVVATAAQVQRDQEATRERHAPLGSAASNAVFNPSVVENPPPQVGSNLDPADLRILTAMADLGAVSSATRKSQDKIAQAAVEFRADRDSVKDRLKTLKRLGYTESKGGRGGGCWLTDNGTKTVENSRTVSRPKAP